MVYEIENINATTSAPYILTKSCDLASNYTNTVCQNISLSINKIYEISGDFLFRYSIYKNGVIGVYIDQVLLMSASNATPVFQPKIHTSKIFVAKSTVHQFCFK